MSAPIRMPAPHEYEGGELSDELVTMPRCKKPGCGLSQRNPIHAVEQESETPNVEPAE